MKTCESCTNRIGDGHPYGDITCRADGKMKYERNECSNGEHKPILSDGERIKLLLKEVESLKNCANCRHIIWGVDELLCTKNWVGNKMDKCDHWQKL